MFIPLHLQFLGQELKQLSSGSSPELDLLLSQGTEVQEHGIPTVGTHEHKADLLTTPAAATGLFPRRRRRLLLHPVWEEIDSCTSRTQDSRCSQETERGGDRTTTDPLQTDFLDCMGSRSDEAQKIQTSDPATVSSLSSGPEEDQIRGPEEAESGIREIQDFLGTGESTDLHQVRIPEIVHGQSTLELSLPIEDRVRGQDQDTAEWFRDREELECGVIDPAGMRGFLEFGVFEIESQCRETTGIPRHGIPTSPGEGGFVEEDQGRILVPAHEATGFHIPESVVGGGFGSGPLFQEIHVPETPFQRELSRGERELLPLDPGEREHDQLGTVADQDETLGFRIHREIRWCETGRGSPGCCGSEFLREIP